MCYMIQNTRAHLPRKNQSANQRSSRPLEPPLSLHPQYQSFNLANTSSMAYRRQTQDSTPTVSRNYEIPENHEREAPRIHNRAGSYAKLRSRTRSLYFQKRNPRLAAHLSSSRAQLLTRSPRDGIHRPSRGAGLLHSPGKSVGGSQMISKAKMGLWASTGLRSKQKPRSRE